MAVSLGDYLQFEPIRTEWRDEAGNVVPPGPLRRKLNAKPVHVKAQPIVLKVVHVEPGVVRCLDANGSAYVFDEAGAEALTKAASRPKPEGANP